MRATVSAPLPPAFGPYKVLEQIESLGGATVYLARQTALDRLVTLTVFPTEEDWKSGYRKRFERQIAAASRVGHPNVVRAIDAGSIGGFDYIAAEYAGGTRLSDALARREWFPMRRCTGITLDIARALEHLASKHILHRAVTPRAIVLADSGVAKLRGFSLSKIQEGDGSQTWFDVDAHAARYMAPEVARADARIDARADLYSLGCVAYHLVTGAPPFQGAYAAEIQKQQIEAPVPDPRAERGDLPEPFAEVILRCLEKKPIERYRKAADLVAALRAIQEQPRPAPPAARRRSRLGWLTSIFKTPD
jgi:serine/threonine-protein kinase